MTRAKIEPVTVASTQKRKPRRAAAEAASSSSIRRFLRYIPEYQAETKNASVATQACGTWKKTIREDSPTKFWAGRVANAVPDGIGDHAVFGLPLISTLRTVTVDGSYTVGTMLFTNASSGGYTLAKRGWATLFRLPFLLILVGKKASPTLLGLNR